MLAVLQGCERIVINPPPAVALKTIDAIAIEVELLFRVASAASRMSAQNEIIDLIYEHCRTNGVSLAMPAQSLVCVPMGDPKERAALTAISSGAL